MTGPAQRGPCPRCGLRKASFATRRAARDAARKITQERMRAYRCGPVFHLTSMPARWARAIRKATTRRTT